MFVPRHRKPRHDHAIAPTREREKIRIQSKSESIRTPRVVSAPPSSVPNPRSIARRRRSRRRHDDFDDDDDPSPAPSSPAREDVADRGKGRDDDDDATGALAPITFTTHTSNKETRPPTRRARSLSLGRVATACNRTPGAGRRPVARARRRPRLHETPRGSRVRLELAVRDRDRADARSRRALKRRAPREAGNRTAHTGRRERRAGSARERGRGRDGARRGETSPVLFGWVGFGSARSGGEGGGARARARFVWEDERTRARTSTGRVDAIISIDRCVCVHNVGLRAAVRGVMMGASARRGARRARARRGKSAARAREANPPRRR